MSRIILSRHDNGEEHITVGWDRPLGHFFWSECDGMGEGIDESYMDHGLTPQSPRDLFNLAAACNDKVFHALVYQIERGGMNGVPEVLVELNKHKTLDYPASNVELDLSERK